MKSKRDAYFSERRLLDFLSRDKILPGKTFYHWLALGRQELKTG